MRRIFGLLAIATAITAPPASSLAGSMPPDIAKQIEAIGRIISVPKTSAIYAPLHAKEPYAGVKVVRDVAYGPAKLNRLDVFSAETSGAARPVLIYVHGGGFMRGNKRTPNTPFYDNIMLWAAHNGLVGVNINYRLAPKSTWPSGPEDIGAAVRWVRSNIASYGGDPSRIYLMGSSAGGNHVASYVAFQQFHAAAGSGLAGAILVSGVPYDLTTFENIKDYKAYFGSDASKYPSLSPMPNLLKSPVALMVVHAGFDPPGIARQSTDLIEALCKARRCPTQAFLKTHSHISENEAIGTNDTELSDQLLAFVRAGKPTN